ncbi:MAG: SGNH/GDSL hydrolase family protein [Pseudomonadota bacterium]
MDLNRLALFPLILTQGIWTAARAKRLPAPAGARNGATGHGPVLRLVIVGDSSAEGVGVSHQDEALSGRLVDRLAKAFTVEWRLIAATGATARSAAKTLAGQNAETFDLAVIALGVNDTKNGAGLATWRASYCRIIDLLKTKHQVRFVIVCGVPPLGSFPLLPQPLRKVLSRRAHKLDEVLLEIERRDASVTHLPMPEALDAEQMAEDGFHPGPKLYDKWAQNVEDVIGRILAGETLRNTSTSEHL